MIDGSDRDSNESIARPSNATGGQGRFDQQPIRTIPEAWLPYTGPTLEAVDSWGLFWEAAPEKHRIVRVEAQDYLQRLSRNVPIHQGIRVLDFGCGTGHTAELLAAHVRQVSLWDGSQAVRTRTAPRLSHLPNVTFVDFSRGVDSAIYGLYDLILIHSVVQYMPRGEFIGWLHQWGSMLAANGSIILSDLVVGRRNPIAELLDLLLFAARERVLLNAVLEEAASTRRYMRARSATPLLSFGVNELEDLAASEGLHVESLPENLGHKRGRRAVRMHQ